MLVTNDTVNTIDQREQQHKELARIEALPRPQKWQAIRDFTLKMHPGFIPAELDFIAAVRDLRESQNFKATGASKSLGFRHVLKIPQYMYSALVTLDPELMREMSGKNPEEQTIITRKLFDAFPMYRACRTY